MFHHPWNPQGQQLTQSYQKLINIAGCVSDGEDDKK